MISLWFFFWLGSFLIEFDVKHWWDMPFIFTALIVIASEGAFEVNRVFNYFDKD